MAVSLNKDDYLNEIQLAELWGMKRNTLQKWRSAGLGPKYIKRVGRVVYRKSDIVDFENGQTFQGTGNKIEFLPQS
jgi:predicted site-specific integrase-resolvase